VIFASPVAYSADLVPAGPLRFLYQLNPMTGVIQGFRWALLGGRPPGWPSLLGLAAAMIVLVAGIVFFKWTEDRFADVV
jgi:lipopolysaccharide transport system permease protein